MWIDFCIVSSINKSLQLCFRLFWKWREMNTPPSRAGSKLIWRKAKGCFARQRRQVEADRRSCSRDFLLHREGKTAGGYLHHVAAQRTAHNVIKRGKKFTFIYVKLVWVCGLFIRHGFLRSYCSEQKQNTFSYETSFYLYKSMKDKKKEKVCGSEGRTSVTNCGIRMRNKGVLTKKINANKQCKQEKNKNKRLTTF